MRRIHQQPLLLISIYIASIISCTIVLTQLYLNSGISSTWLLVLLFCIGFISVLIATVNKQAKQLTQVIRALANGDSSLGFAKNHRMRDYYDQVKQQMQAAKFATVHQTEFLKTLLVHIELAVIVCNVDGKVIESNPAVARLLGKSIKHLKELDHIATMVLSAKRNLRSSVQWQRGETLDTLSLQMSIAQIQGNEYKILTLQSIHETLINKEQQAYKRLTQVLTHEVANTITPLASIAQTCQGLLPETLKFSDEDHKQDLALALKTLATRTQYLGAFIASFRKVSSLPIPQLSPVNLTTILKNIKNLFKQQLIENDIELIIDIKTQQLVMLDNGQIEQVLINLIKNAIEALQIHINQRVHTAESHPFNAKITLTLAKNENQQLYLQLADNGEGIPEHALDMIFVPFYTTKQQGTGIGLSLSKQIMINHGGDLIYFTQPKGACFRCIFG